MNAASPYALCEVPAPKLRHRNRRPRQHFPVAAWRFREARFSARLTVEACAELLRVSERTVRHWESGKTRIPYAAYKLMRVMRSGKLLGPEWRGFHIWYGVLHTPEGHRFEAGDLAWWSLLVRRARAFSDLRAARDGSPERPQPDAASSGTGKAPACRPAGQQDEASPGGPGQLLASLGLVYYSTKRTRPRVESGSTAENKAVGADHFVGAEAPDPGPQPGLRPARDPAGVSGQPRLAAAIRAAGGAA